MSFSLFLQGKVNITFDGKEPIMTAASLMWDLTDVSLLIDGNDFILLHADFFS